MKNWCTLSVGKGTGKKKKKSVVLENRGGRNPTIKKKKSKVFMDAV